MATTRTFPGVAGILDLRLPVGHARVTVDPAATRIIVALTTADDTGPSADAISDTETSVDGERFNVHVPNINAAVTSVGTHAVVKGNVSNGSISVSQNINVVDGTLTLVEIDGDHIVLGRIIGAGSASPIEAAVTIPAGVALVYSGTSAPLTVTGHLTALQAKTVSGRLRLASVGALDVNTTSGRVEAEVVFGPVMARTVSGNVVLGSYQGNGAVIKTVSGNVKCSAGRDARGLFNVKTVSGNVRLRGVDRLEVSASTVSGRKSIAN